MATIQGTYRTAVGSARRVGEVAAYDVVGPAGDEPEAAQREQSLVSLRRLARLAAQVCETPSAVVNVLDAAHQHRIAAVGVDPMVCAVEDSMCALVLAEARTVMVPDATVDERFRDNPFVTGRLGSLRLYASAPLVNSSGYALGTLCVLDTRARELSERQLDNLTMLAGQVVDVLELRRRTLTLTRAHAELARSNRLLSEFAGRLSHDLKSPLTAVQGFAQTLRRLPATTQDARAAQVVDRITAAGDRMRSLIDEMLAYASVGGGLDITRVDLASVMDEVLHDLSVLLEQTRARVTVLPGTLDADHQQLRVLLQNLVANAVAYRRPDRPCEVQVGVDDNGHGWVLRVADNGMGIPAEHRDDVLRPLFRLDRDAGISGTGLGLPTCVRVAEAHRGTVTIEATPGGGTTVTVEAAPAPRRVAHVSPV